ncbi:MAG TPA: hypothetical protein DCY55_08640 [Gammaproteobacteria bacterium]|jgi:hypothetical protein|nr:hypothetical protein [Gammaproteobacteria bacterium]|tara:strand:- start:2896 stop:3090 length:195 start_codon:yes stop_codon:yes gene_type:complete
MNHKNTDTDVIMASMEKSVARALERKRRLGQYAVVTRNGKLTRLQPEEIKPLAAAEDQAPYNSK